ncbi:hypothetical protein NHJ6243_001888 [Beauveria neobassiana]
MCEEAGIKRRAADELPFRGLDIKRTTLVAVGAQPPSPKDRSASRSAPADGWPDLTPEHCAHFRGDYALQVLRHLPYLGGRPPQHLHYQCEVADYTAVDRAWFVEHHMDGDTDEWWSTLSQVTTSSPISVSNCTSDASCKPLENSGSGTASACAG